MRVIVTRPRTQADALVSALRRAGVDAVALPLIDIVALPDPAPLQQAWRELQAMALVMFVSANAVQHFMRQRPPQMAWPLHVLAGSTGPGTSAALRDAGVPAGALIEPAGIDFDSEALWTQLQSRVWQGRRVLVVRGENGRDWLADRLGLAGAQLQFVAAYQRRLPQLQAPAQALLDAALAQPLQHVWVLSSSEAVANLGLLAPQADWSAACAWVPHARILARATQLGFGQVRLSALDVQTLVQALPVLGHRSIQSGAL